MPLARAELESILRTRQLDRTLTTALPLPASDMGLAGAGKAEYAIGSTGVAALDARLGGGLPRGQLSEIAGPRSSGRASLQLSMLAAATARGEIVALVDVLDMFDVESAAAAGVDLDRLLWIRGRAVVNPGLCRDLNLRAIEQAIRALSLVLSAGNFGLVVFDAGEAPAGALRRLPFTTWLRLQRMIEGQQTICVLVGSEPMARSSAGLTIVLGASRLRASRYGEPRAQGLPRRSSEGLDASEGGRQCKKVDGWRFTETLFEGLDFEARVVRARARMHEEAAVALSTAASYCA